MFRLADLTYRAARRLVITIVGGTVLLIGVAMLVLPGPAMVVIPIGLAILGIEFAWARRFLGTIKEKGSQAFDGIGALWRKRHESKRTRSGS
jgi:tellurite resistance protein TerC